LGFGAAALGSAHVQIGVAAAFVLYEALRIKPAGEKIGGVAEFATGFLAGHAARGIKCT
jgi:hypothetical protein